MSFQKILSTAILTVAVGSTAFANSIANNTVSNSSTGILIIQLIITGILFSRIQSKRKIYVLPLDWLVNTTFTGITTTWTK